jgi:hypothetical protein
VRDESACFSLKTGAGTILAASYIDHVRSVRSGRTKFREDEIQGGRNYSTEEEEEGEEEEEEEEEER